MKYYAFIFLFCAVLPLHAQYHLIGDAAYMNPDCIQLTPDVQYSEGIAYYKTKLDLANYFQVEFDIYLGDKDEGADGITFVIHDDERQYEAYGTWGECMGYGRWNYDVLYGTYIAPSIAVEFDTYYNRRQNDPPCDHVAYLENGTNFHIKYWNNKDENFNLEDDYLHNFRFQWEPDTKQVTVYLDDRIVYRGIRDVVKEVFGGQTQLIWGFTASTGRKHNLQYFCLRTLTFRQANK
ncbi:MAG: lectin [Cytophagales bacterium]|nr:MAG: lectin [Cytophagales bacterium]